MKYPSNVTTEDSLHMAFVSFPVSAVAIAVAVHVNWVSGVTFDTLLLFILFLSFAHLIRSA